MHLCDAVRLIITSYVRLTIIPNFFTQVYTFFQLFLLESPTVFLVCVGSLLPMHLSDAVRLIITSYVSLTIIPNFFTQAYTFSHLFLPESPTVFLVCVGSLLPKHSN